MSQRGTVQPFYGNYSTYDSHTNTEFLTRLRTRQDGVENLDEDYLLLCLHKQTRDVYNAYSIHVQNQGTVG